MLAVVCGIGGGILAATRTEFPTWGAWLLGVVVAAGVVAFMQCVFSSMIADTVSSSGIGVVATALAQAPAMLACALLLWNFDAPVAVAALLALVEWFVLALVLTLLALE